MRVVVHNWQGVPFVGGNGHGWRDTVRTVNKLTADCGCDQNRMPLRSLRDAQGCEECRKTRDAWAQNKVTFEQASRDLRKHRDAKPRAIADWLDRRATSTGRRHITSDDVAALNREIPY